MPASAYLQQTAPPAGSSFYYAFLFLPAAQRQALLAWYAFCREVSRIAPHANDPNVAQAKLAWWQAEADAACAARASHPALVALTAWTGDGRIEPRHLHAVIDAARLDLQQTRYLDFAALQNYCHLAASVPNETMARLLGQTSIASNEYAHHLGLALQLTRIIRNVGQDAKAGRIYLPLNELQQFGVKAHELLQRESSADFAERFQALMRFQSVRARQLFDQALAALSGTDRHAQKPGLILTSIYRALLTEIERGGFPVLYQRVGLSPLRKFWLAWKMQALGF